MENRQFDKATPIAIEGLDGCGKKTQSEKLVTYLEERGVRTKLVSFPAYDEPLGDLLKRYLDGEFYGLDTNIAAMMYTLNRAFTIQGMRAEPISNRGAQYDFVVCDRYVGSNFIHQMPRLRLSQWEKFIRDQEKLEYEYFGLPKPSLTICLDMHPDITRNLLMRRYQGDRSKMDALEHNHTYNLQCRVAEMFAAGVLGWKVVDCSDGLVPRSEDDISNDIINIVNEEFSL